MVFYVFLEGCEFGTQLKIFTLLELSPTDSTKRPQQRKYALAVIKRCCLHTYTHAYIYTYTYVRCCCCYCSIQIINFALSSLETGALIYKYCIGVCKWVFILRFSFLCIRTPSAPWLLRAASNSSRTEAQQRLHRTGSRNIFLRKLLRSCAGGQ